ncbi:MAG: efflux RND transporter periplasmic adaptor subunit [Desulfovermiculus sp.]|nr:efflux RND transporter periplasmic adaptor subunit [Desulfovermiculus sp.]
MIKRIVIALCLLGLVFGGVFGWRAFVDSKIQEAISKMETPPVAVSAMPASRQAWVPEFQAVASLQAVNGVEVTGEMPGLITVIHFQSGQKVKQGELLVELDMSTDRAQLESLQAAEDLARVQYSRLQNLVQRNMAPQSDLDEAEAKFKQTQAEVRKQRAVIDKKKIRAPFDGVLGLRKVDKGQYMQPGVPLVSLQAMRPIYVEFSLPQENLPQVELNQPIEFRVDTWVERVFQGRITAFESRVSSTSRNIKIQATIPNTEQVLRPGMFGQVRVEFGEAQEMITLPQTAISSNPYGDVVFVLTETEESKQGQTLYQASRRFVHTGRSRGDQVAVTKGIEAEDLVVTAGGHKLREGAMAVINNQVEPAFSPEPEVPNT